MNESIRVTDLTKHYPEFTLGPLQFRLPAGYIMGMIGPNGAGKTTTLRLLLDMIQADSGQLALLGADTPDARVALRDVLGVSLDSTAFPDAWNAQQISQNLKLLFSQWDSARFFALLAKFDVNPKTRYKKLSKGTQNKLNLAAALSHHAKLLILDEPAAGLDPIARDELLELLQAYIADGVASVLLSSHITEDLEQIADYLVYLQAGQQVFFGETQALLDAYRLVQGGASELTEAIKAAAIGLRQTSLGWSALLPTDAAVALTDVVCEPVNLETLMRYFGKQGGRHAMG